ncbi:hypothetical protein EJ08DRAFT_5139 [Tothia fuscella]|uniref:Uncharacterized protein n=1 Tax=Tothia fuscella TaxID=1048955 RepID=A0A9P4U587_9PEZI|nr:hypothetical protein EJ08DRAFT_5139 [Tothia fuscella]
MFSMTRIKYQYWVPRRLLVRISKWPMLFLGCPIYGLGRAQPGLLNRLNHVFQVHIFPCQYNRSFNLREGRQLWHLVLKRKLSHDPCHLSHHLF